MAAMTITAIAAMARISPMIRLVMVVLGFKHFDRPQHDGVDKFQENELTSILEIFYEE